MVAAAVLGLAVDNTFHLMYAAGTAQPVRMRAALRAFERVGRAAAISSAALALGFLILALSGFAPTARFGLLCAVGAASALLADLVVLPARWIRSRT
jgi:predicted RND superfamily exporter protein